MAVEPSSDASAANGLPPADVAVASRNGRRPTGSEQPVEPAEAVPASAAVSHELPEIPAEAVDRTACSGGFGTLLEPAHRRSCQGRLSAVNWFRTDWQRGGAVTGYATYTEEGGVARPVVVKLPVPPCERYFLVHLQTRVDDVPVAPRLFAHGEAVNGYDLAWVVMERLNHGPLGPLWNGREFDLLVEALGRFYAATDKLPRQGEPLHEDWESLLARARQHAHDGALPHAQHWNKLLKAAGKKLPEWLRIWHGRPVTGWCHGDVHLANAMTREAPPQGPALLFDYAKTRVGHWVQDAIYFEHLFWARPQRLAGRKLTRQIAHERKRLGLEVDPDWARLAEVYRTLLAMATPAVLDHDGDPAHLEACLGVLERAVR